jgi:hypothetical protein
MASFSGFAGQLATVEILPEKPAAKNVLNSGVSATPSALLRAISDSFYAQHDTTFFSLSDFNSVLGGQPDFRARG